VVVAAYTFVNSLVAPPTATHTRTSHGAISSPSRLQLTKHVGGVVIDKWLPAGPPMTPETGSRQAPRLVLS
jgi:hypothetical protein